MTGRKRWQATADGSEESFATCHLPPATCHPENAKKGREEIDSLARISLARAVSWLYICLGFDS